MNSITINGTAYPLKFGLGFLRTMNNKVKVPVEGMNGVNKAVGFKYKLADMLDGSVEAMVEMILVANKNENPSLPLEVLEAHIEDENTDIDALYEEVLDFLRKANSTKRSVMELEKALAEKTEE